MNRNFLLLAVAVFCLNVGFGIYFATFNNFTVERIGIEPDELGFMEALREVPGLLNAGFNALLSFALAPLIGARIGQLRSVGSLASLAGLALLVELIDYSGVYLLAGLIISLGGADLEGEQLRADIPRRGGRIARIVHRLPLPA